MCILWAVAPAHRHDLADDVSAQFQTGFDHRSGDDVGEKRIRCNDDIRPRHSRAGDKKSETLEERMKLLPIIVA
jgi:hypothetical protein